MLACETSECNRCSRCEACYSSAIMLEMDLKCCMLYSVQLLKSGGVIYINPAGKDLILPESEYNEEDVLSRASQGDRDAFGQLYERYVERIFNYVYYRTGNLHDAEDLTARVFQRAMNHIKNYTDRGVPFSAWLYRIAHNLVANWHRDRSRKQEIPLDDLPILPTKGDHPEKNLVRSQEQDALVAD